MATGNELVEVTEKPRPGQIRNSNEPQLVAQLATLGLRIERLGIGLDALLALVEKRLIAVRDPFGFRPLVLGRVRESYVVASETCALDLIEARVHSRDRTRRDDRRSAARGSNPSARSRAVAPAPVHLRVHLLRPSRLDLFGQPVYHIRKSFGHELAQENPVEADMVIPVPDSGIVAALGYPKQSGIPFEMGLIRNHYVGRTFIEPEQSIRHFGVKLKLNPVRDVLEGKRVVVVDDSIVRGTTSRKIVKMIREAGAREVHMRISSPPTRTPAFSASTPRPRSELIAATHTRRGDQPLPHDRLARLPEPRGNAPRGKGCLPFVYCDACFSGNYPIRPDGTEGVQLGLF